MSNYFKLFKIFWLCICVCSCYGLGFMIDSIYDSFKNEPVAFIMDTNEYLKWNTSWPALVLCEKMNLSRIRSYSRSRFNSENSKIINAVHEATFGNTFHLEKCFNEEQETGIPCFLNDVDIHEMITKLRDHCEEIFSKCYWNGREFPCCEYFQKIFTERGLCFALNSLQADGSVKSLELVSNYQLGTGNLTIQANSTIYVSILSPAEIPLNNFVEVEKGTNNIQEFSVIETINDNIRDLTPKERKCHFHDEIIDEPSYFSLYSPSSCQLNIILNYQIQYCNCTTHKMESKMLAPTCNLTGILCLSKNADEIKHMMNNVICPFDCEELTIKEIVWKKNEFEDADESYGQYVLKMQHLPTEKHRRMLVRGNLDLVVAFGGAASLIFGASLLSLVEIFYFIIFRPLSDLVQKYSKIHC